MRGRDASSGTGSRGAGGGPLRGPRIPRLRGGGDRRPVGGPRRDRPRGRGRRTEAPRVAGGTPAGARVSARGGLGVHRPSAGKGPRGAPRPVLFRTRGDRATRRRR